MVHSILLERRFLVLFDGNPWGEWRERIKLVVVLNREWLPGSKS